MGDVLAGEEGTAQLKLTNTVSFALQYVALPRRAAPSVTVVQVRHSRAKHRQRQRHWHSALRRHPSGRCRAAVFLQGHTSQLQA